LEECDLPILSTGLGGRLPINPAEPKLPLEHQPERSLEMTANPVPEQERPGHHWREPERVQAYIQRVDAIAAERKTQFELLARLIPFGPSEPIRVLDVGAGHGVVAAAVLDAFPNAHATLMDISEEMIRVGHERMAPYNGRFEYLHGDFADGVLPAAVGDGYHAVVSAHAIHHLPPEGKAPLYKDIARRLRPGGCFLNLDRIAPPSAALDEVYRRADPARSTPAPSPGPGGPISRISEMQPLENHLQWLAEAGLINVDCFWKRLGDALFGGYRST
jgi:tRNA (cmo5U34)-methyltransferase